MSIKVNDSETWPPHYTVRRSLKARRTFLQISPTRGLEIVIPERQRNVNIPKLLHEKRRWIEKILGLQPKSSPFHIKPIVRPSLIECQAISETWKIAYQVSALTTAVRLTNIDPEKTLLLTGNVEDFSACQKILIQWLIKKAKIHFTSWLQYLSALTKLEFNRMIIRGQSTL